MPADFLTGYPKGAFIRRERSDDALRYVIPNPIVNAGPEAPNMIKINDGGAFGVHPEALIRVLLDQSVVRSKGTMTTDLVAYQDTLLTALEMAQNLQES